MGWGKKWGWGIPIHPNMLLFCAKWVEAFSPFSPFPHFFPASFLRRQAHPAAFDGVVTGHHQPLFPLRLPVRVRVLDHRA